jgi:hypothetical protein
LCGSKKEAKKARDAFKKTQAELEATKELEGTKKVANEVKAAEAGAEANNHPSHRGFLKDMGDCAKAGVEGVEINDQEAKWHGLARLTQGGSSLYGT